MKHAKIFVSINILSTGIELVQQKIQESDKRAIPFMGGIGFNYPFYTAKEDIKWLNTFKKILVQYPEHLGSNEKTRNSFDQNDLSKAVEEAITVFAEQVE